MSGSVVNVDYLKD
jgi:hypothetical protein